MMRRVTWAFAILWAVAMAGGIHAQQGGSSAPPQLDHAAVDLEIREAREAPRHAPHRNTDAR